MTSFLHPNLDLSLVYSFSVTFKVSNINIRYRKVPVSLLKVDSKQATHKSLS